MGRHRGRETQRGLRDRRSAAAEHPSMKSARPLINFSCKLFSLSSMCAISFLQTGAHPRVSRRRLQAFGAGLKEGKNFLALIALTVDLVRLVRIEGAIR